MAECTFRLKSLKPVIKPVPSCQCGVPPAGGYNVPPPRDLAKQRSYVPDFENCEFLVKPHFQYYRSPLPPPHQPARPTVTVPICFDWSQQQLDDWLISTGFGRYRAILQSNGVNGKVLINLDANDFRRMGIRDSLDCQGLADAIRCLTGRTTQVKPEAAGLLQHPYYPALFFEPQANYVHTARRLHHLPVTETREPVWRTIYSIAGDRFAYVDSNRPTPTI